MDTPTQQAPRTGEAAHTPTPWLYREARYAMHEPGSYTKLSGYIQTSHDPDETGVCGKLVAAVVKHPNGEAEANAAFIVRACNSHAELVAALEEVSRESGVDNLEDAIDRLASLRAVARAALSRAKGGSQ